MDREYTGGQFADPHHATDETARCSAVTGARQTPCYEPWAEDRETLEGALRVVLASALVIHSILDITDPCTGAKSRVLQVDDSIPCWLLPAVAWLERHWHCGAHH